MLFVIYSPDVHSRVCLAQTDTQEQAWKLYLEHEWEYQEQPDGTYHGRTITHETLQAAMETYGLKQQPDGSCSNADERFASEQEAQAAYGIKEQEGTVNSHDRSHPNLAAALRTVPWQAHRLEIAPATIDPEAPFQVLFTSKDEWDYIGFSPKEDVKADIIEEHRWLARRYEWLKLLPESAAELRKGLRIAASMRDKVYFHEELARLLSDMGKLPAAAAQFEAALRCNLASSNPSQMHSQVAKIYLQLNQRAKALRHYRQIVLEDLDDEEAAEVKEQLADLQQQPHSLKRH